MPPPRSYTERDEPKLTEIPILHAKFVRLTSRAHGVLAAYWTLPISEDDLTASSPCVRVSQVPRRSVDARRPLAPRVVRPLHMLVTARPVSGFMIFGSLTTTKKRHEAETGSLSLRLMSSPSRAPTTQLPTSPPSRLHGERAIAVGSTSQLTRSTRLSLAHRSRKGGSQRRKEENARDRCWSSVRVYLRPICAFDS